MPGSFPQIVQSQAASISHALCSFFDRTMSAAVKDAMDFYAMTNNAAPTVMARRSQGSDGAFKAVEDMGRSTHDDFKGFVIVIATSFTLCHVHASLFAHVSLSLSRWLWR